jgi:hypothetical protein
MNPNFQRFVEDSRAIARARSVTWNLCVDSEGVISKVSAWNLTRMSGGSPPPTFWLRDLGTDSRTVAALNGIATRGPAKIYKKEPLSTHWQEFIKAIVIHELFVRQNTTSHILQNVVRPLRVLGTCAASGEPWKLTADDLAFAFDVAKTIQPSGKLSDLIFGVVRSLLDPSHLTDNGPLSPTLTRGKKVNKRASKMARSASELLENLQARKRAEKLPDRRAFWELVRIVFTETPHSFMDLLLFAQARTMLITGLRIGEVALLPADWKRYLDFQDRNGRPAGDLGGYSRSLMLRHFAEKQRNMHEFNMVLFETVQHIPPIFEEILTDTLEQVVSVTAPLRNTLKRQITTGRSLPQFKQSDVVRAVELYTYLTGNPIIVELSSETQRRYTDEYEKTRNPQLLEELRMLQLKALDSGALRDIGTGRINIALYSYFRGLRGKAVPFRRRDGSLWHGPKVWNSLYVNIGEIERYESEFLPTKQSDVSPLQLASGALAAWELMFLMPKRALADGRSDGFCDVTRQSSVGRMDTASMTRGLGGMGRDSLFTRYGQTDDDRALTLNSHSLRHLQNTELFRLGIADTAITKRFNRRSVAQSYEYDHRSLAEELERIDLSPEIEERLGEKSSIVVKMIKAGRANGPIVNAFRRIQREHGEDAALDFLSVEADGFHSTPYGHCLNSFTVDPCPKHLECFTGCRHLSATNLPENRRNLVQLEGQLEIVRTIQARESHSIGRENQLAHGLARLSGVRKVLATPPGSEVFPDGPDLSIANTRQGILDGIS